MKNKEINRYRPCSVRCVSACFGTFALSSIFISISTIGITLSKDNIYVFLIGLNLLIINVVCVIFSVFKWNSFVYIDGEKIRQKQFGKAKTLYYSELTDIKLSKVAITRGPWLVVLRQNKDKISIEITTKAYEKFCELCTDENAVKELKKALKDRHLD